jgi:hypothetical protein
MNGPIDEGPAGTLTTLVPSQVKVMVLNGSSQADRTSATATGLASRGFNVVGTGYAPPASYRSTVIEYAKPADLAAARTLSGQFSQVRLRLMAGLTPGTVDVILGSSFTSLAPPKPTSRASIRSLSDSYGGITASVSCRNSAFYSANGTPQAQNAYCPCG